MRRFLAGGLLALLFATTLAPAGTPRAHAEIDGPCDATVNGQSVAPLDSGKAGDAIKVEKDDVIEVAMTSAIGFESHKIEMEIAGLRIPLQDEPDGGDTQWSGTAEVSDYADYGVGLYKVVGEGRLVDGTVCTGAVLIEVEGSALTSIAGLIALALLVVGLLILGGTVLGGVNRSSALRKKIEAWSEAQARRIVAGQTVPAGALIAGLRGLAKPEGPITLWMLAVLPLFVMIGAIPAGAAPSGGGASSISRINLPRMPFRPGLSLAGTIGSLIATQSIVVLVQQFAISPLTASNEIFALVAGLVLSVVFATGVKLWGSRNANAAINAAEARFNEALAQVRREAGLPPAAPGTPGGPPTSPPPASPPEGDRAGEP